MLDANMAEERSDIKTLLDLVKEITEHRAAKRKEREKSGSLYNIFDVLGLTSSEVRLHSSFIASLLRPDKHGAGRKFLEAFLKMPVLKLSDDFLDLEKVKVEQEMFIGRKTDKRGGRLDLFISDGTNHIIVENKIHGSDGEHQLLRYHNYRPNGVLVYLSLYDDAKPSADSLGGLDPGLVTCISYESHIMQWLEECVQIAFDLPQIRETINQYINTIKKLTGTNNDMETNSKTVELLTRPEYFDAVFEICDNFKTSTNAVMNGFVQQLESELERAGLPFTCKPTGEDWFQSYMRIDFVHKEWKYVVFSIEFEARGLRNMIAGVLRKTGVEENVSAIDGAPKLAEIFSWHMVNNSWLWGAPPRYMPTYWNNAKVMKSLTDGEMVKLFIRMLKEVAQNSEGLAL